MRDLTRLASRIVMFFMQFYYRLARHSRVSGFCVDTLLLQKSSDFANREDLCFWKMFIQKLNRYGVSPDCFIRL